MTDYHLTLRDLKTDKIVFEDSGPAVEGNEYIHYFISTIGEGRVCRRVVKWGLVDQEIEFEMPNVASKRWECKMGGCLREYEARVVYPKGFDLRSDRFAD